MELRDYVEILRRRWISVLIVALAIVAVTSLATLAMPKKYTATTRLYFAVAGDSVAELAEGSNFAERQMSSYAQVATSPRVLDAVIQQVPLSTTSADLANSVVATVPPETVILEIVATDPDPRMAAEIANAVGAELTNVAEELAPDRAGGSESVQVTTIAAAQVPYEASSPNVLRNLGLGLALGTFLGFGLAVLRHVLDTRIRSEEDVRRLTATPILGVIAYDRVVPQHPVILHDEPLAAPSEEVRRLRTNLQFIDVANRPKSIVISSSIPDEGKSIIAINLAVSLADTGARVILVDADLRRPTVAEYLGMEGNVGLTTVLIGRADVEDVVQRLGASTLDILPAGQLPPNPSELLGSPAMAGLLDRLTATYDMVLLDSPPLLPVTDAAVLSKLAGGVLLVVGADRMHRPQLQETLVSLETAAVHLLGIVLNKTTPRDQATYSYGSGYAPRADDGPTEAGEIIPNWDWDHAVADPAPLGARDGSVVATKDEGATSSKQDVDAAAQHDLTASAKPGVTPVNKNESGPAQQHTSPKAKQHKVAAAQQNVTVPANQDEVAPVNQGEPVPANQDEVAPVNQGEPVPANQNEVVPTKQENAPKERYQAEPPWPSPPWLAEPVASQSQRAPHRRSKSRRR